MALFEAHNLHKRFGDQVVLEEINLRFEEGRLSGIMGPNGAGKTTCFNVLTGRYKPDRGRVIFRGNDITGYSPEAVVRQGISRSFQIMSLFDDYSALDNIVIALPRIRRLGLNPMHSLDADSEAHEQAVDILHRVGLNGRENVNAKNLSYGERRALEIGIALATMPEILFIDEPTAGLGADAMARLSTLIAALKESTTIVMIEHDMRFLFELADHISVIHWGQVIAEGTPNELRRNRWVQRSNLGALA